MKIINQTFSFRVKLVITFGIILSLCACEQTNTSSTTFNSGCQTSKEQKQIWGRLRKNYNMAKQTTISNSNKATNEHQKVQKYVKKYKDQQALKKMTAQATPYLYYIVEQLEKRNMPGELALLPIIESAFQPHATSNKGAAGIWQFIPSTGRHFGLKQNTWYDGRRDIAASTKAALDYLEFLHEEFDHNWMLALAAYNSGEGTVRRAIKRNQRAGKPTSFWDLNLPKETKEYVPKFLAIAELIGNSEKHKVMLADIDNQPYFKLVNMRTQLNFKQAAKLAEVDIKHLKQLNAGFKRATTHPTGPQHLVLPVANAEKFEYNSKQK